MRYKNLLAGGTTSVGTYDKTKISIFGRVSQKTIDGKICYGPGLTRFIDLQTDFAGAFTSSGVFFESDNGRLFIVGTAGVGFIPIALYTFNLLTGDFVPVGRINFSVANSADTTHTVRFIRALDSGTTNWKIVVGTIGTVAINGGIYQLNKIDLSDFQGTPTFIFPAITSDIKAVYKCEDPAAQGAGFLNTTIMGGGLTSGGQVLTVKGSAALFSFDAIDTAIAPAKTVLTNTAPVINSGATTFDQTAHGLNNNDPFVFVTNPPAGFTASPQGVAQTVYFARNVTANTFQASATSGGAAILGTTVTTPSWTRAFGQSTNQYVNARKTGNINISAAGSALLTDSMKVINPQNGPNAGQECFFFPTTTNFYHFRLSGITNGATTVLGLVGVNNLGSGLDYVAPTTNFATYSDVLDKIIYTSLAFNFYLKNWQNNVIVSSFGSQIAKYLELQSSDPQYFRAFGLIGLHVQQGWIFANSNTTGQRGILAIDARSDASFGHSYLISPVQKLSGPALARFVATLEKFFDVTDTVSISLRSANTATDPIFNSETGGFIDAAVAEDLNFSLLPFVQAKVTWDVLTFLSGIPTQLQDVLLGHDPLNNMSTYWKGLAQGTSSTSPSTTVYRQIELYPSGTPALFHRSIDDAGNVVEAYNTVTHLSQFTHSLDEGITFLPGVGPNQIGKRLRLSRLSPPGVIVTDSLRED